MEKYSWNFNKYEEHWGNDSNNTVEECIVEAKEVEKEYGKEHDTVYIGENMPFIPSVDAESVLDDIMEQAGEFAGEVGEDWDAYDYHKQNELDELSESLTAVVNEWLKKHDRVPYFWAIERIKPYSMNGEVKTNA